MTQTMPHLVRYPTHVDFLVNGKPTLLFGGEIRNSSASTHAFLDTLWKPLRSLSLNFVLVPFSWRQFEPDEGTFDESLLSAIIQSAKKEGYSIAILWLATWKNGYSGYAPTWMWKNPDRFPLMSAQAFSPFGSETLKADQRAFTQLMKSIRALDPNGQTVVLVQVENEMGLLGDTRDRSPLAQQAFGSPVPSCLTHSLETHLAELKPAIRDVWTRHRNSKDLFSATMRVGDSFPLREARAFRSDCFSKNSGSFPRLLARADIATGRCPINTTTHTTRSKSTDTACAPTSHQSG